METISIITSLIVGAIASILSVGFYRLYLSPLSKIPGPKLAALTRLYEAYYDCIKPGQFTFETDRLHEKYGKLASHFKKTTTDQRQGPIVRIGPNEVHINDPEYFDELYALKHHMDKDPFFYRFMGTNESSFATISYNLHRKRRSKENAFFSRAMVDRLEPVVSGFVEYLCSRISEKVGDVVDMHSAYRSLATDVVAEYSFIESYGFLKPPDFSKSYHDGQDQFNATVPWLRNIPYLAGILVRLPEWIMDRPSTEGIHTYHSVR